MKILSRLILFINLCTLTSNEINTELCLTKISPEGILLAKLLQA